jgi:hypothetical protein
VSWGGKSDTAGAAASAAVSTKNTENRDIINLDSPESESALIY